MRATRPQSQPELLDVLIVGAGLSGIGAARHLQRRCPGKRYAILEARTCIGGTWDLFRYPGVRSDSDMYTLGYDFKPWTEAKAIADGAAILRYIRQCADEDGITPHIRFGHAVRGADWASRDACWTVTAERSDSGERVTLRARKLNVLGDVALRIDGRLCALGRSMAYKGMMLSDVPNLAMTFGYTNASWTLKADLTAGFVCRLLRYMDRRGHVVAVPRRDPAVQPQPFLSFTSGYVQRALAMLPKQGSQRPWQVHQNYLLDLLTIRYGRLADGVMQFSDAGIEQ